MVFLPIILLLLVLLFFFPPASNTKIENTDVKISLDSENLDKGKSILGALPKLDKKDVKNPKAKKANS